MFPDTGNTFSGLNT